MRPLLSKLYAFKGINLLAAGAALLGWVCPRTLSAGIVYHGSSASFVIPIASKNTRYDSHRKIIWQGEGVFAAADRRVALIYTSNRKIAFHQGVDLWTRPADLNPIVLTLYGGSSQEEALIRLYGTADLDSSFGYIYCLSDLPFYREQGLGILEVVSRLPVQLISSPACPAGVEKINRRLEIEKYLVQGALEIRWVSEEPSSFMRSPSQN